MFGDNTYLFERYVKGKPKLVLPFPLSIIDCFFLAKAFQHSSQGSRPTKLVRISDGGKQVEDVLLRDVYDLYDIDREADGFEVVLVHEQSGSSCYWDVHERFVVAAGSEEFLALARPYPEDVERHHYVEGMLRLEGLELPEKPESIYEELKPR